MRARSRVSLGSRLSFGPSVRCVVFSEMATEYASYDMGADEAKGKSGADDFYLVDRMIEVMHDWDILDDTHAEVLRELIRLHEADVVETLRQYQADGDMKKLVRDLLRRVLEFMSNLQDESDEDDAGEAMDADDEAEELEDSAFWRPVSCMALATRLCVPVCLSV